MGRTMAVNGGEAFLVALKSVFVLYLVILGNFLPNLLGCRAQKLLRSNHYVRHVAGFLTLYSFVVYAGGENAAVGVRRTTRLPAALAVYTLFVLSTRMTHRAWIAFMMTLLGVYALQLAKDERGRRDPETNPDGLSPAAWDALLGVQIGGGVAALCLLFGGLALYVRDKVAEYGPEFSARRFIVGQTTCRDNGNAPVAPGMGVD
jgi:hypothetical protein